MDKTTGSILHNYDQALARIVLQCVRELPFQMGIRRTIGILRGSHAQFVIDHDLHRISMYGVLAPFAANHLKDVIDALLQRELLEIKMASSYQNLPTLVLTGKGEKFLTGQQETTLDFAAALHDREVKAFLEDVDLTDADYELYEALRELRLEIAQSNTVPPYIICNNATLRELAREKPTTIEALESIKGIGRNFADKYGDQFIDVILNPASSIPRAGSGQDPQTASSYQDRLKAIKAEHPRAYESWSDDEDKKLGEMVREGRSTADIAKHLQRQPGAIRSRINKLGLN